MAIAPPSTRTAAAFTKEASSLHSHTASSAFAA
jgi:hypothetical protein